MERRQRRKMSTAEEKPAAKALKKVAKPLVTEILRSAGPKASRERIDRTADRLFGELRDIVGEMLPVNTPLNPSLAAVLDEIRPEECGFSLEEGNKRLETRLVSAALAGTGGSMAKAAAALGISNTRLRYIMAKHGMKVSLRAKHGMKVSQDVEGQPDIEIFTLMNAMEALEKRFLRAALNEADGDRVSAAEMLGLKLESLIIKIKEHGLRHL